MDLDLAGVEELVLTVNTISDTVATAGFSQQLYY